jgi:hypothetical protein
MHFMNLGDLQESYNASLCVVILSVRPPRETRTEGTNSINLNPELLISIVMTNNFSLFLYYNFYYIMRHKALLLYSCYIAVILLVLLITSMITYYYYFYYVIRVI